MGKFLGKLIKSTWWLLGPVKPKKIVQILLTNGSDDLYTIQNRNPKLQPNGSA